MNSPNSSRLHVKKSLVNPIENKSNNSCFTCIHSNILLIGSLGATSISIGVFLYLSQYEMSGTSPIGNNGPGQIISSVPSIRLAIFLITTALIGACAVFNVLDFRQGFDDAPMMIETIYFDNFTVFNETNTTQTPSTLAPVIECTDIPPVYLFLCGLSLSAISAFLRAGFILKLLMMILTVVAQTLILYTSTLFQRYELLQSDNM